MQPTSNATRPNFVFILADDSRPRRPSLLWRRERCSPNLDRLAAEGLRFTNGYANSSVCSPSRFAIATGRYQHRLRGGFDEPIATCRPPWACPRNIRRWPHSCGTRVTPRRWSGNGTSGSLPWFGPLKSGYDEFFGHRSRRVDFFTHHGFAGPHDLWEGDEEVFGRRLPDGSADRPGGRFCETPVGGEAVPALASLQCAALALGGAR